METFTRYGLLLLDENLLYETFETKKGATERAKDIVPSEFAWKKIYKVVKLHISLTPSKKGER